MARRGSLRQIAVAVIAWAAAVPSPTSNGLTLIGTGAARLRASLWDRRGDPWDVCRRTIVRVAPHGQA